MSAMHGRPFDADDLFRTRDEEEYEDEYDEYGDEDEDEDIEFEDEEVEDDWEEEFEDYEEEDKEDVVGRRRRREEWE